MSTRATYSPEDNKLRLYSTSRLDRETYDRVKAAGFRWAPKQELFVAPAWTPAREDLLLELCGEIGDEDTSLVERAEERAERFEDLSDKRMDDAERARQGVAAIADNIPLGQPILVGHHSERHARRDAEKIQSGMRRAVRMWETSKYWTDRARGAIHNAKYKELPAVRARRIKKLETDLRRDQKNRGQAETFLKAWSSTEKPLTTERAMRLANYDYVSHTFPLADYPRELPASQYEGPTSIWSALNEKIITAEQARDIVVPIHERYITQCDRWISHLQNRLAYERAMLDDAGGTVADKTKPEKGGACKCWASPRGGWSEIVKVNKVSVTIMDNWGNGGKDFPRTIPFDKLTAVLTREDWERMKAGAAPDIEAQDLAAAQRTAEACKRTAEKYATDAASDFGRMKSAIREGTPVQVVSAPQLFPTPPELAARVVREAAIDPTHAILEPSAGTGRLLDAINLAAPVDQPWDGSGTTVVEISLALAESIRRKYANVDVRCSDFLALNGELGTFDRIVMNPPFANDQDIAHVRHAWEHLKPGGRLVSIMSSGFTFGETKARREFRQFVDEHGTYEVLPDGSFANSGTNVRAVMVVLDKQ